jgi:hypothetical protein
LRLVEKLDGVSVKLLRSEEVISTTNDVSNRRINGQVTKTASDRKSVQRSVSDMHALRHTNVETIGNVIVEFFPICIQLRY